MTSSALEAFVAQATARSRSRPDPADCVLALAPLMLDLIDQAGTFLEPEHYRSSATGYTRNLVFNEMRRAKRHPHLPIQIDPEAEELPLRDEATETPDAALLQNELQKAIESAITQLPDTQRMALVLRRYEELSYEEIADILELSLPAVKSLLFRARTELRERLKGYLDA